MHVNALSGVGPPDTLEVEAAARLVRVLVLVWIFVRLEELARVRIVFEALLIILSGAVEDIKRHDEPRLCCEKRVAGRILLKNVSAAAPEQRDKLVR